MYLDAMVGSGGRPRAAESRDGRSPRGSSRMSGRAPEWRAGRETRSPGGNESAVCSIEGFGLRISDLRGGRGIGGPIYKVISVARLCIAKH